MQIKNRGRSSPSALRRSAAVTGALTSMLPTNDVAAGSPGTKAMRIMTPMATRSFGSSEPLQLATEGQRPGAFKEASMIRNAVAFEATRSAEIDLRRYARESLAPRARRDAGRRGR